MTSDRPYREAMPSRVARLRLAQAVETQFDTSVVAAFEAILAGAPEAYRLGKSADFRLEMREHEQERRGTAGAGASPVARLLRFHRGLRSRCHIKLLVDVLKMRLDGLWADEEPLADLVVVESLCRELKYLALAG